MSATWTTSGITIMPLAELRHRMQYGCLPTLVDVRTPAEYSRVHAEGARSLPLDQLNAASANRYRNEGDGRLYVICHSGTRATEACLQLQQEGLAEVYMVEGGTAAWENAGLPVVRGKTGAISLERQVRIGAGSLVLLGAALGWLVHPGFFALSALVGAGLLFAGITDYCGMGIVLSKMPWNSR
jgi:rhodanese-related sulfurtransferase